MTKEEQKKYQENSWNRRLCWGLFNGVVCLLWANAGHIIPTVIHFLIVCLLLLEELLDGLLALFGLRVTKEDVDGSELDE